MDPVTEPEAQGEETAEIERRRMGDARWWLGIAATVFLALWAWRELGMRAARERIASRDAEIASLAEQNTLLVQRNEKLRNDLSIVTAADTRTIALTGQPIAPAASARVFIDPARRRAVAIVANLPENPDDKSYQLWIMRADQPQPQSAAVFDVTRNGASTITVENMPPEPAIRSMAVTLERKGGAPQPGSADFYLMSNSVATGR